jgi:hypothetical protein
MAEIASRAVVKGESNSARKAIISMTETVGHYLDTRKSNLSLFPVPDMPLSGLITGDVDTILSPIYEHLVEVNRRAVEDKAQSISISIVESLGNIAIRLCKLGGQSPRLTWKPIAYLGVCVTKAQKAELHDVPMRASRVLLGVGLAIPIDDLDVGLYTPIFQKWGDIVRYSLVAKNPVVADSVLKEWTMLIRQMQGRHPVFDEQILYVVLADFYQLIPLCLINEMPFNGPYAPYAMTNESSLGYIVEATSERIQKSDSAWTNPFAEFIKINEHVSGHFRSIADHYDIGASRLVWEVTQTIEHISKVFLKLLGTLYTENQSWKDELANQIRSYIAFFWAAFKNAKVVDEHFAYEACKVMGWVGILYYENGYSAVSISAIGSIASVSKSFNERGEARHPIRVAALLMFIWQFRILAEAKEDTLMIKEIDKELESLEMLKGQHGQYLNEEFTGLQKQLMHEIVNPRTSPLGDEPLDVLKYLLMNEYPAMFQRILDELYGTR